ncbi:MAG: RDD family protein [Bacteroidota bacterium]
MPDAITATRPVLLRRIGAYLLDVAVLFVVLAPLGYGVQVALGIDAAAATARSVYITLILNFSIPAWLYFALSDRSSRGATVGKRLLGLRTQAKAGRHLGFSRALGRTAIKMVPWEVTHASAFLFVPALGEFAAGNMVGIGFAYVLSFVYLFVAWRTDGRQSVHDLATKTHVVPADAVV